VPGRIVQHQQRLLPGQVIPPARCPGVKSCRDLRARQPRDCQQQVGQRARGIRGRVPRRVAVQRHEVLAVRKSGGELVRGMDR
jgi:hypothetical protein